MKVVSIAFAGMSIALIVLTLLPSAGDYRPYLAVGALVCAAVVLVTMVVGWREGRPPAAVNADPPRPAAPNSGFIGNAAESAVAQTAGSPSPNEAPTAVIAAQSGTAEVVGFLAVLQDKGRLVDFLEDDITSYSDAQVGAAARVVHQGCKGVLREHFRIVPVRQESEGTKVTVAAGFPADEYRFVGKISGQAPFSGTLMHRGWKVESVHLPRILHASDDRFPTIAPAEVELR